MTTTVNQNNDKYNKYGMMTAFFNGQIILAYFLYANIWQSYIKVSENEEDSHLV